MQQPSLCVRFNGTGCGLSPSSTFSKSIIYLIAFESVYLLIFVVLCGQLFSLLDTALFYDFLSRA